MRFSFRLASLLGLVLILALGASGCQRQRAENTLRKTQARVAEIEQNYNGAKYNAPVLAEIKSKIDQANSTLESDAKAALTTAQAAKAQADQLLEEVKPQFSADLYNESITDISIAERNDLPRLEPERYTRITNLRTELDAARQNSQWDKTITLSNQIREEVRQGLAPLVSQAERAAVEATQALTNLKEMGGNIYAPEVVIAVQTEIDAARANREKDKDYATATNQFAAARVKAESGITLVLREKSREVLEQIEGYLSTALLEGALQFKREDLESAQRLYDNVLVDYQSDRYNAVLEASKVLLAQSQKLVIDTKRAASDDFIATMASRIRSLEQGGIQTYLPTSLEQMRQLLAQARQVRTQDTEEAFDRIKQMNAQFTEEYRRQNEAFGNLALDAIRNARNSLEASTAVFERMEQIFDEISASNLSPSQTAFESQKRARQTELAQRLSEAGTNLLTADQRQQREDYRGAIVLADEVRDLAQRVLGEVYHTVAHNAAIELAQLISRYERDGARQYAQEELARSVQKLEQVKQLTTQGSFKEAVERAAETRADVELMAQRIAGRATVDLREARLALDSAASERTRRFRGDMLNEVRSLIEQGEVDLQEDRLKIALETAARATSLARQAQNESAMLAAEEQMAQATAAINEAQTAGASIYAGREVEDARKLLNSARTLYNSEQYEKSEELATSSFQRARSALMKKIDEAEAAIASATAVNAWDYSYRSLARANTDLREAREALDRKDYNASRRLADSARGTASSLASSAKRKNFDNRVARIQDNLAIGTNQGINFFQPEESIAVRRELVNLQNQYSEENYERVMTEIEKLEASLRGTLDTTSDLVGRVDQQLSQRLDRLHEAGATLYAAPEIAEARERLRYARLDYRRGLYKSAHSNLQKAIELTREVEHREAQTSYAAQVSNLFARYDGLQRDFSNVLTMSPQELKELATSTSGGARAVSVSAKIRPNAFRSGVDTLYEEALVLPVPQGLEKLHESVIQSFAEGRLAAQNFEKLVILDRMTIIQARNLIDDAYIHMNNSNRLIAGIEQRLTADQMQFSLVSANLPALVNQGTAK